MAEGLFYNLELTQPCLHHIGMTADVVDLHAFYGTGLGQMARRALRQRIRHIWPNLRGESVLGLGYATPLLSQFQGEAQRVIALMPASQGVIRWPRDERAPDEVTSIIRATICQQNLT